ncbi:hypothetical protein ACJIZ3_009566 [Penstemon smallii]|uniref:F-box domain-containing protein n=1 Tax=Penstemon smallii TaxID=265156 RepID=A0ABD3TCW3_9LAMI
MRKKARVTEPRDECDFEDYVSSLPDEILVSILSLLTLKEAVVTSNLSRRMRYTWTHISGLDFDANDKLDKIAADPKSRTTERPKYINWVNRVLRQHKGSKVDSFRICFDLDKRSKCAIDHWVKFAITKGVQTLELDLLENGERLRQPTRNYTFSQKLLSHYKGFAFNRLEGLVLKCVNVSEEALQCLISNCPVLKYLSMHGSGDLMNVKVSGPSLTLKYFEIVFCLSVETIEISNVNLVAFSYLGPRVDLNIYNVPMLDEISIGEGYTGLENNVFGQLSCCLYQLEVLTLDIYCPEENIKLDMFPELPKLKQLILRVGAWDDDSLLEFTSFVKACPNLNRFVLQLIWMSLSKRRRKIREAAKYTHRFLKLVEIVGYYGRTSDAEIAMYFFENAVALEKIIIDPRYQVMVRPPVGVDQTMKEENARRRAKQQLEAIKPPGVQLVIL